MCYELISHQKSVIRPSNLPLTRWKYKAGFTISNPPGLKAYNVSLPYVTVPIVLTAKIWKSAKPRNSKRVFSVYEREQVHTNCLSFLPLASE